MTHIQDHYQEQAEALLEDVASAEPKAHAMARVMLMQVLAIISHDMQERMAASGKLYEDNDDIDGLSQEATKLLVFMLTRFFANGYHVPDEVVWRAALVAWDTTSDQLRGLL